MILDLKQFKKKTMEVALLDETTVHLKKPTQRLIIDLMDMEETVKENQNNPKVILELYNDILIKILNNNDDNREFDLTYINQYFDLDIINVLITEYMKFVNEIQSEKN